MFKVSDGVFIVNFGHISHFFLMYLLLTWFIFGTAKWAKSETVSLLEPITVSERNRINFWTVTEDHVFRSFGSVNS